MLFTTRFESALYNAGFITDSLPSLLEFFSFLILALGLTLCWCQWKLIRAYKHFPSQRLDTKWLLTIITGRYRKDVPPTSVLFQVIISEINRFQTEGLCVMWFLRPYLVIFSDEFMKPLLNEISMVDKSSAYSLAQEVLGNGLLRSDKEMWKVHRKLLNPVFYMSVLKGKISIFNANAAWLVEKLQSVEGEPIEELLDILKYCSFNNLSESILGIKMSDEKYGSRNLRIMQNFDKVTELSIYRLAYPWLYWKFLLPFSNTGREYLKVVNEIHSLTNEVVEELKKSVISCKEMNHNLHSQAEVRKSFAQILIEQHLEDPTFTMDDVRDQLANFILAGYDTTSGTLMWCCYLLGQHPDVQEKAFKEIESVVMGDDVTFDDLGQLKYLNCVIKETLRLYSIVPVYGRRTSKEIQCGQYKIPKGTEIALFAFLLHRNPYVYPDPGKFDPERFSETSIIRPWMHIPFSEGYRNCIGKNFAMMQMKVLLVHVLRRFKITSLNKIDDSDLDWTVFLKAAKPIRMLFTPRESQS